MDTNVKAMNMNEMEMTNGCGSGVFIDHDDRLSSIVDGTICGIAVGGLGGSAIGLLIGGPPAALVGGIIGIPVGGVAGGIIGGVTYEEPKK